MGESPAGCGREVCLANFLNREFGGFNVPEKRCADQNGWSKVARETNLWEGKVYERARKTPDEVKDAKREERMSRPRATKKRNLVSCALVQSLQAVQGYNDALKEKVKDLVVNQQEQAVTEQVPVGVEKKKGNLTLCVDRWALHTNINSRNYNFHEFEMNQPTAWVRIQGIAKFDKVSKAVHMRCPYWTGYGTFEAISDDGVFGYAEVGRISASMSLGWQVDDHFIEDRLKAIMLGLRYRAVGMYRVPRPTFINMVISQYNSQYQKIPYLYGQIDNLMQSEWWAEKVANWTENVQVTNLSLLKSELYSMALGLGVRSNIVDVEIRFRVRCEKFVYWINPLNWLRRLFNTDPKPDFERQVIVYMFQLYKTAAPFVPCARLKMLSQVRTEVVPPEPRPEAVITRNFEEKEPDEIKYDVYGATFDLPSIIPTSAQDNLESAVLIRMAKERKFDECVCDELDEHATHVFEHIPFFEYVPPTREELYKFFQQQYGTKRADRLILLVDSEPTSRDLECGIFVKKEVYVGKTKTNYKPRMIWSRSEVVIALYSHFFYHLSKHLKIVFDGSGNILYASGVTPEKLGDFCGNMEAYDMKCEADASNWDGSIILRLANIEIRFLLEKTNCMTTVNHMKWLIDNWCKLMARNSTGSLTVVLDYGRRSGDLCTSSFNSLLNIVISTYAFGYKMTDNFKLAVLGDDGAIAGSVTGVDTKARYEALGFDINLIYRESVADMGFCSGWFYPVDGRYIWGNDAFKVLMKLGVNLGQHNKRKFRSLLNGIALGMLTSGGFVPILGTLLRAIADTAREANVKILRDNKFDNPYRPQGGNCYYPSKDTYDWFCNKYHLSVEYVLMLEEWIRNNVTILDCPYLITDTLLRQAAVDTFDMSEDKNENLEYEISKTPTNYEVFESYIVNDVPRIEEAEKLLGVSSVFEAAQNGYNYGLIENEELNTCYHEIYHSFFSILSYVNFTWGVAAHSMYNKMALRSMTNQASESIYQFCARKKKQVVIVQKVAKKRRNRKRGKSMVKGVSAYAENYLLSQTDPFFAEALGAKYPDTYSMPTATMPMRDTTTLTGFSAVDSFVGAWMVLPWAKNVMYTPASITQPGVITWSGGSATQSNAYTIFSSASNSYRVVGYGVRITCETALTATDGHIWVTHINQNIANDIYGFNNAPANEASISQFGMSERFPLVELTERPLVVCGRRVDDGALRFRDDGYPATASPYAETGTGWCDIVIFVRGVANIPKITIERIVHIEYIPNPSTSYGSIGEGVSAPPDISLLEAGYILQQNMPIASTMKDEEDNPETFLAKMFGFAVNGANAFMQSRVGQLAAQHASARLSNWLSVQGGSWVSPRALEWQR